MNTSLTSTRWEPASRKTATFPPRHLQTAGSASLAQPSTHRTRHLHRHRPKICSPRPSHIPASIDTFRCSRWLARTSQYIGPKVSGYRCSPLELPHRRCANSHAYLIEIRIARHRHTEHLVTRIRTHHRPTLPLQSNRHGSHQSTSAVFRQHFAQNLAEYEPIEVRPGANVITENSLRTSSWQIIIWLLDITL